MKTALIVDDTKNIRILLSHCLKDSGFKCIVLVMAVKH